MENNTFISIITATRNCADTLEGCLASVAQQSYLYREHVIIDGASTDGTIDIINQHINQISTFVSERDSGIYDALNKGIKLASGDVIGFLHADDLYASDDVLTNIAKVFADPTISAVYGDLVYISQQDTSKIIRLWKSNAFDMCDLALGWMPAHPTLYVRREWYSKIGGFNTNYRIAADYLSVLQLFMRSDFKSVYLPDVFIRMRLGGVSNKSLRSVLRKSKEDWMALRSCNFNVPNALRAIVWKNLSKLSQFAVFSNSGMSLKRRRDGVCGKRVDGLMG